MVLKLSSLSSVVLTTLLSHEKGLSCRNAGPFLCFSVVIQASLLEEGFLLCNLG